MGGYDRYSSPDHLRNMSYDDDRMGSTNMRGRSGKSGGYPNRLHRQRGRSSTYQRGPRQSIRRSRSMNDLLPRTPSPSKRQVNIDLNDSFPVCRRFPNCSVCAIDIPQYNQNVRWLSKKWNLFFPLSVTIHTYIKIVGELFLYVRHGTLERCSNDVARMFLSCCYCEISYLTVNINYVQGICKITSPYPFF